MFEQPHSDVSFATFFLTLGGTKIQNFLNLSILGLLCFKTPPTHRSSLQFIVRNQEEQAVFLYNGFLSHGANASEDGDGAFGEVFSS